MSAATHPRVLVADIGGTNCRLALARRAADGRAITIEALRVMPTPSDGFEVVARDYLANAGCPRPEAVAVAAAGRLRRDGRREWISMTNALLTLERESLEGLCRGRAWLANDLAAVAAALPHLGSADFDPFGPEIRPSTGRRLVLGVGTGLGAALLTERGETIDSEAGHADLPSVSADEHAWCATLSRQGRVSNERVLCGPGLLRLHAVIGGETVNTVDELLARWGQGDAAARATLTAFSTWLGRVAGNLVLSLGAWGGVYLIGGVIFGLGPALDPVWFRRGFEDKAPYERDLANVPVQRVTHPQPALVGMAAMALDS